MSSDEILTIDVVQRQTPAERAKAVNAITSTLVSMAAEPIHKSRSVGPTMYTKPDPMREQLKAAFNPPNLQAKNVRSEQALRQLLGIDTVIALTPIARAVKHQIKRLSTCA